MSSPTPYTFEIIYGVNAPDATWLFDDQLGVETCKVNPGDQILFTFSGPGIVTQAAVLTGQLQFEPALWPFKGAGGDASVMPKTVLTVGPSLGLWVMCVAFAVLFTDGATKFYFVPDPELQVGSIP